MSERSIIDLLQALDETTTDLTGEKIQQELAARCDDLLEPLATILRCEKGHAYVAAWLRVATLIGWSLQQITTEVKRQIREEQSK